MSSIAVFNNKGGVGKTTLLCNLASYIALKKRKKILVIDADPQCNATQSMLHEEELENIYEKSEGFTLWNVASPLKVGKGFVKTIKHQHIPDFGVDLLPGDPQMSLMEDTLSQDWLASTSGDERGLRTTLMFYELLSRCGKYDYVFFDMGPSLGAINRSILLACDYFIIPTSIDIFSIQAIRNISSSLIEWRRKFDIGLGNVKDKSALEVEYKGWNLRFGGYVTQQYTSRRDAEGQMRAVKAYERILKKIPIVLRKEILVKYQHLMESISNYELGTVPYFHSLIPLSQTSNKPIFQLTSVDGIVGAHFTKVKEYEGVMQKIAVSFEQHCDND